MKAVGVPRSRDQQRRADSGARGNERSAPRLTRLVCELLDAHADTEHLSRTQHSELLWHAHLCYLRDLQRVAREVLADVS